MFYFQVGKRIPFSYQSVWGVIHIRLWHQRHVGTHLWVHTHTHTHTLHLSHIFTNYLSTHPTNILALKELIVYNYQVNVFKNMLEGLPLASLVVTWIYYSRQKKINKQAFVPGREKGEGRALDASEPDWPPEELKNN